MSRGDLPPSLAQAQKTVRHSGVKNSAELLNFFLDFFTANGIYVGTDHIHYDGDRKVTR